MNKSHYEILKTKYYDQIQYSDFLEMLENCKLKYANKTAFKLKNKDNKIYNVTYSKFISDVKGLATYFLNMNLCGKPIAIIGKNSYNWCVSYLAASIIGVVVPLDKELKISQIINFLNVSKANVIISDNKYLKSLYENVDELDNKSIISIDMENSNIQNIYNFDNILEKGVALYESGDFRINNIRTNKNETKILLFTSGTTGNAKAVKLSQFNILSDIVATNSIVRCGQSDLFLSILPIHHTYECTLGFLLPIYNGSCIAFCDGLKHIAKNMQEYKPTIVLVVPLLLENMYNKIIKNLNKSLPEKYRQKDNENPFSNLPFYLKPIIKRKIRKTFGGRIKYFIVGAAAMDPNIIKNLDAMGLNTLQGYGLTECAPLVTGNSDMFKKYESTGLPIKSVEVKILDPNEEGVGEILVKGPNVMLGYLNNEEETNKVLKDGWFHTGDLGFLDKNGYLHITGRIKSVIVTKNGKNIYPEEVEHFLNESPIISESLVEGISDDDNDDPYILASVYPNYDAIKEYFKDHIPTKEQIHDLISKAVSNVNSKLPNYKKIRKFDIRDEEFEKTTTKKIMRHGTNLYKNYINKKKNDSH